MKMIRNALRRISGFGNSPTLIQSSIRHKSAYNGDGKTTVRVLNQETELGLMIDSFSTFGFRLNSGVTVLGAMAIFPRTVLSWQVKGSHDVTPESLRFFAMLEPKIDLLVIGVETKDRRLLNKVHMAAKAVGLNVELLQTEHACTTFNFLNADARSVAGAFIPPTAVDLSNDDRLESGLHYDNLYNSEEIFKDKI